MFGHSPLRFNLVQVVLSRLLGALTRETLSKKMERAKRGVARGDTGVNLGSSVMGVDKKTV